MNLRRARILAGPRRWVGAVLVALLAGYLASLLLVAATLTPVSDWFGTWAPRIGEVLPGVQTPTAIGSGVHRVQFSSLSSARVSGSDGTERTVTGWAVIGDWATGRAFDGMIEWAALHVLACSLITLIYVLWGHPPLLRGSTGVSMRAVLPRTIAISACLAVPLPAATRLLHVMWWSIAYGPPERGGVPMLGLAVGLGGIGALRAGAILLYVVILAAVLRRVARRAWRSRDEHACPRCSYSRSPDEIGACPECASLATPQPLGASFMLGSAFIGFRRSRRGRVLTRAGLATLIVLLLLGPWVLGSLDNVIPQSVLYAVDDVWYSVVRFLERWN